jgi:glucokinase
LKGHAGRAGHLGHITVDGWGAPDICGMPGSLEDAIGNGTLAARCEGRYANTHELVAAYLAGEALAITVWERAVQALAVGIASLINVLDPEAVVIGGGISVAGDALFEPLSTALSACEWRPFGRAVPLLPAELGTWAGACGAAFNAMSQA